MPFCVVIDWFAKLSRASINQLITARFCCAATSSQSAAWLANYARPILPTLYIYIHRLQLYTYGPTIHTYFYLNYASDRTYFQSPRNVKCDTIEHLVGHDATSVQTRPTECYTSVVQHRTCAHCQQLRGAGIRWQPPGTSSHCLILRLESDPWENIIFPYKIY